MSKELCPDCEGTGFVELDPGDYADCGFCQGVGSLLVDDLDHLDHADPVDHDYQLPEVKPDAPRP